MEKRPVFDQCLKLVRTERVTRSAIVSNTPSLIFSVSLQSDGGEGEVAIHDGSSAKAERKVDLSVIDDRCVHFCYIPPMYMTRGIFVNEVKGYQSATIRYADFRE